LKWPAPRFRRDFGQKTPKRTFLPHSVTREDQAQGKRRKKFETINEVWKIAPSTQRIA
jgi:hypothetical protein